MLTGSLQLIKRLHLDPKHRRKEFFSVITSLADDWVHVLIDGYECLRKESIRAYLSVLAPTATHVVE